MIYFEDIIFNKIPTGFNFFGLIFFAKRKFTLYREEGLFIVKYKGGDYELSFNYNFGLDQIICVWVETNGQTMGIEPSPRVNKRIRVIIEKVYNNFRMGEL